MITMILMNMQSKLYTIQFFSPPSDQFAASPREQNPEIMKFPKKFELPDKRELELMENEKQIASCLLANPQPQTEGTVYGMEYSHWPA